jgi:hypothetical protein
MLAASGISSDRTATHRGAGPLAAGGVVFNKGDPGAGMHVVQSGVIERAIGDKVIEVCGPNEARRRLG